MRDVTYALALTLWIVFLGNVHLAAKINIAEAKYDDGIALEISSTSGVVEALHERYRIKTRECFGF